MANANNTTANNTTALHYVMARAWAMVDANDSRMDVAMTKAWDLARLEEAMRTHKVVYISYLKKDGSLRKAMATLKFNEGEEYVRKTTGYLTPKTVRYFDLGVNDWRCFKVENLVSWHI